MQAIITIAGIPCHQPSCLRCGGPTKRHIVEPFNPNFNADRPYYKCSACPKFSTWADARGVRPEYPQCHCGHPSRAQITGREKTGAWRIHFVCTIGGCNFFGFLRDQNGHEPEYTEGWQIGVLVNNNMI